MRYDFTYIQALQAKARRERSEAMYEMLIAPIVGLFTRAREQNRAAAGDEDALTLKQSFLEHARSVGRKRAV